MTKPLLMQNRILGILFLTLATQLYAQESFDKDSRRFDIKLDMAAFSGTVKDNYTKDVSEFGAASLVLASQMSWAVSNRVSIGGSVAFSNYLDSAGASGSNPTLRGLDGNFLFDIHLMCRPKTDMILGLKLGIAGIRYNPDDGTGDVYGSPGTTTDLHWTTRFYVSEKIAIIANLAFPRYRFGQFGKNLKETSTVNFSGYCIGTGVTFKLPNKKTGGTQRNK